MLSLKIPRRKNVRSDALCGALPGLIAVVAMTCAIWSLAPAQDASECPSIVISAKPAKGNPWKWTVLARNNGRLAVEIRDAECAFGFEIADRTDPSHRGVLGAGSGH